MAKDVTVRLEGNVVAEVRIDKEVLTLVDNRATARNVSPGKHYLQRSAKQRQGLSTRSRLRHQPEAMWKPDTKRANPGGLLGGSKVFQINQI